MKFDWYQASIPDADPNVVMATLAASEFYGEWQEARPIKGYSQGARFVLGDEVLFKINHGGQNLEFGPNVLGSGSSAPKLAGLIRNNFPNHRVSRVDACEDYFHADAYDYLRKLALRIAKDQRVQCREIVKPLSEFDDGRTLYLGAESSSVSMRIYEKGKQLGCDTEWVRAELQVRPQKSLKDIASMLSPVDLWGTSKWSHAMAIKLGNDSLQRVDAEVYQPTDHNRAYRFMLKQYARCLESMLAVHGSPEAVGAQIFHDLADIASDHPKASLRPV
jgi:hypothetical protein